VTAQHWAGAYIGTPWVAGVSDCWSFARTIWADRFGWLVPPAGVDVADPRAGRHALSVDPVGHGWTEVAQAQEGDAVLMAVGARPCHVGVWVAVKGAGVIFTIASRLGGIGYRIIGIYRRAA
jgi:cell wall-associated NlpC family hydrolase